MRGRDKEQNEQKCRGIPVVKDVVPQLLDCLCSSNDNPSYSKLQPTNQQKGQRLKDNLILAAITAAWILQIWTFVGLVFTVGCLGFGARGRASHWDQLNLPSLPKWSIDSPLYIIVINRYTKCISKWSMYHSNPYAPSSTRVSAKSMDSLWGQPR